MAVKPIPDGYHTVTPYLAIDGAAKAIEFYTKAFGAVELFRFPGADGKLGHAEIKIGDSRIMMADEFPQMGFRGPKSLGGSPAMILLYVPDVDAQFKQAVAAGAKVVRPLHGSVLRRPLGHAGRSLRPRLDHRHSQGRRFAGRIAQTFQSANETTLLTFRTPLAASRRIGPGLDVR